MIRETAQKIANDPKWWKLYFYDFVDDFRRSNDNAPVAEKPATINDQFDAMIAASVETLCLEKGVEIPAWTSEVPACQEPFFVAGLENMKATALVESPLRFRIRKVFVTGSFMQRV
jgi:hypothetical protein